MCHMGSGHGLEALDRRAYEPSAAERSSRKREQRSSRYRGRKTNRRTDTRSDSLIAALRYRRANPLRCFMKWGSGQGSGIAE